MDETIDSRIADCETGVSKYNRWLKFLRIPNIILLYVGSALLFIGGASIIADKSKDYAGYITLVGGLLTGLHGWAGCTEHQQRCWMVAGRYHGFLLKFKDLKTTVANTDKETEFKILEASYIDFVENIDAKPWF